MYKRSKVLRIPPHSISISFAEWNILFICTMVSLQTKKKVRKFNPRISLKILLIFNPYLTNRLFPAISHCLHHLIWSQMLEGVVKKIALDFEVGGIAKIAKASKDSKVSEVGADIEALVNQSWFYPCHGNHILLFCLKSHSKWLPPNFHIYFSLSLAHLKWY